jgi:hypothetical protein
VRSRSFGVLVVLAMATVMSASVGPAAGGAASRSDGSPTRIHGYENELSAAEGSDDVHSEEPLGAPSGVTQSQLGTLAANPGTTFAGFNSINPERLLDTRTGVGVAGVGAIGPGQSFNVQFAGRGSIPADATAVIMNVTADAPSAGGFITVYPAGEARPDTSNINTVPGKTVPNLVVMRLNGGAASFFNAFGAVHLIADVTAYARTDGHFVGLTPARILDTRSGAGAPAAKVGPGGVINVPVLGLGGVPGSGVGAVVLNVTVDQPSDGSFVTVWPTGDPLPNASSLNMLPGQTVANLVFAPVGAGGGVSFFNERGTTNILADVVGYIPAGAAYMPITPVRILDSRTGLGGGTVLGPGTEVVVRPGDLYPATLTVAGWVFNVTAAGPTEKSFLTVYPTGSLLPNASNLNTVPGENVPNAVVVRPGTDGTVRIRNDRGFTHIIVDLVGIVPLQNALDAPDDAGGHRFHVVYVYGNDDAPEASAVANIRSELEAMNGWMAMTDAGTSLDFARTNGVIDVTTWQLANFTRDDIVFWDDFFNFDPLIQLVEDGFGFPYNHRWLIYIEGDRSDGTCGIAVGQFATVFTSLSGCGGLTVDGAPGGGAAVVGSSANTELVALHEAFHSLGAVPTCGNNDNGSGHILTGNTDLMFPALNPGFPKVIDINNDSYFGHTIPGCTDLQDSPYMANVAG